MTQPIQLGTRRELFVDDQLIARLTGGATLRLHSPTPREISFVHDRPWEGNMSGGYCTVFQDGDIYRMYCHAWQVELQSTNSKGEALHSPHGLMVVYAESRDGIHWERPALGLHEFAGSRDNNIVFWAMDPEHKGLHGFAPFKDPNPACPPEARYKAVGASETWPDNRLYALQSPDGIRWSLFHPDPIITEGMFDSQNLAFWDTERGEYRAYVRDFRNGCRAIKTATSPDFRQWSRPVWLDYPRAPEEQLYTNQVAPYYRAPHLFFGFPTRYVERQWSESFEALPELEHRRLRASVNERFGAALTEGLFMSSRDGQTFRRWGEAFIRPGLRPSGSWAYGDNYQNWGLVETASDIEGAPRELSMYVSENYWRGPGTRTRRYTLRVDGFVSVNAPLAGGELWTPPLCFAGTRLSLNLSTSAAGSARVELLDAAGQPLPGLALADCVEIIGDTLDYTVRWRGDPDLGRWRGQPVQLHVVLRDADLFSLQFGE